MTDGDWAGDVDTTTPSMARMYDYFLGGDHNFAADRAAAEQVISVMPGVRELARANRAFLRRVVRHMLEQGVTQFLDIGAGIPTAGNVHDIARAYLPDARVVYVDVDPVAVSHSQALLRGNPNATAIRADLLHPDAILHHHDVRAILDLTRPVGLLLLAMLHFLPDELVYPAVARLRDTLAEGSYVALSHAATDVTEQATADEVAGIYRRTTAPATIARSSEQILAFFGDYRLVPPGLVWLNRWPTPDADPETAPEAVSVLAGAARKEL